MYLAAKCRSVEPIIVKAPVDRDIRDFLDGRSDGEDLLHALYDHVLDEPVPERLRTLLRR
jgi:Anti-sigma factor NepR